MFVLLFIIIIFLMLCLFQVHHIHDMSNILDSLSFLSFRAKQVLVYFVSQETIMTWIVIISFKLNL
jgi:hypothetical protein